MYTLSYLTNSGTFVPTSYPARTDWVSAYTLWREQSAAFPGVTYIITNDDPGMGMTADDYEMSIAIAS